MVVIESIAGMCQRTYTASIMAWSLNYEISGKRARRIFLLGTSGCVDSQ